MVSAKQPVESDLETGLLARLAPRRLLGRLVGLGEPTRQTPQTAPRLVAPPHQQYAPIVFHQYTACHFRVDIHHEAAGWAGQALTPMRESPAKRGATARAVAHRPPLWVVIY